MSLIDFILNVAALLLWLNWRAVPLPVTQVSTQSSVLMRPRAPTALARSFYLLALMVLIFGRAVFYWQAGPKLDWTPGLLLGPTMLPFRSDFFGRMLLFSIFSFGATLGIFHLWLLLLSVVNPPTAEADPAQRLVRLHLGRLARMPYAVKLLLPLVVVMTLWCLLNPFFVRIDLVPKVPAGQLLGQAAVLGLAVYFTAKFLVIGFLVLYLVNSYVYLGDYSFWNFVNNTARAILRPLKPLPLRIGRVDLAPAVGVVLVALAAEFGSRGLDLLYR